MPPASWRFRSRPAEPGLPDRLRFLPALRSGHSGAGSMSAPFCRPPCRKARPCDRWTHRARVELARRNAVVQETIMSMRPSLAGTVVALIGLGAGLAAGLAGAGLISAGH